MPQLIKAILIFYPLITMSLLLLANAEIVIRKFMLATQLIPLSFQGSGCSPLGAAVLAEKLIWSGGRDYNTPSH